MNKYVKIVYENCNNDLEAVINNALEILQVNNKCKIISIIPIINNNVEYEQVMILYEGIKKE